MANKKENLTREIRRNPWIISTVVLGILVVILLLTSASPGSSGAKENNDIASNNIISKDKAGEKVVEIIGNQAPQKPELVNVTEEKGLYKVRIKMQGRVMPIYVTKDGENLAQRVMSFEEIKKMQQQAAQQQEVQVNSS